MIHETEQRDKDRPAHRIADGELAAIRDRLRAASVGPWRVESDPARVGQNWHLFSCGASIVDGKEYYVTTDGVRASEYDGDAATDAEFIVWCRNDMARIGNAYIALRGVADALLAACEAAAELIDLDVTEGADRREVQAMLAAAIARAKGGAA